MSIANKTQTVFFIQSGTNLDSKTWGIVILFISLNISLTLIIMLLSHCALAVVQLHLVTQSCASWTNVSHNIKETNGLLLPVASTTANNFKIGCWSLLPNIRSTVVWTITHRYDIIATKLWCWNLYLQLHSGFLVWYFCMIVSVISVLPATDSLSQEGQMSLRLLTLCMVSCTLVLFLSFDWCHACLVAHCAF